MIADNRPKANNGAGSLLSGEINMGSEAGQPNVGTKFSNSMLGLLSLIRY